MGKGDTGERKDIIGRNVGEMGGRVRKGKRRVGMERV